ncbi:T9SS type A sorting domain-containing protein [Flavobacterium humi]|uniref:T9SS type A sorting domain-containing protein n=1 Tax=Flavobacterium humi TaxID=2562683 RepID=A0A4Z0L3S4_9FLAO|nr:T9SS type A sorting domain-containing protein [Flavobacterium humi]TGD56895.1 T9SS type A sorting domain-containing protein [Flavobacterium humi]
MKPIYTLVMFFIGCIYANAQLYVGPNSYMYVNDEMVYVKQDVELNSANSTIYLRNNGQLLQGTTGSGINKGTGSLSVFQEGSTNNFQYNYWCSPVGGALAAAGNSPFGIPQLGVPITATATTAATILPSSNPNGTSGTGALSIAARWIYRYSAGTTYNDWIYVNAASTIGAGQGFTMKGTSGSDSTIPFSGAGSNNSGSAQRYDFRGKPNDGTINVPVTNGTMTLTGNPYPSAIDMQLLLTDPTNTSLCDGTALYWEHDKTVNSHYAEQYRGGYGVYNGATNVYTPATFYTYTGGGTQGPVYSTPMNMYQRRFAPIGQGFMLRGISGGNVQIKNTHRVYRREGIPNNSQFERNANEDDTAGNYEAIPNVAGIDYTQISKAITPSIRINASLNGRAVRQIALVFTPNAVDGLDKADSKSGDIASNLPYDMYLFLNNTEYMHSATNFAMDKVFPVGFKNNTAAVFKIQVASLDNLHDVSQVFLHDKVTGLYHDIKNTEFQLSLPAGVSNNRFEITLQDTTLSTDDAIAANFKIFEDNASYTLIIKNPNVIALESCYLYDISGKIIFSKKDLGANPDYEFSTSGLSEGIYIVKLITEDNREVTQKITIKGIK